MRIVVVGGTGKIGSKVVERLRSAGHEARVASRSEGVDVVSGAGLADALHGADAVVDASNTPLQTAEETEAFFGAAATNVLAAEQAAGVRHHVLLSITNMDRTGDVPHYAGKRLQEEIVRGGTVPWTIVRAAQFFEFGELVAGWTRQGDTVTIPPVRLQPVAATDVGAFLAEIAVGAPRGVVSLAGPEPVEFVELVRRLFEAKGESVEVIGSFEQSPLRPADENAFLAPADATLAPTTLDEWLADLRSNAAAG